MKLSLRYMLLFSASLIAGVYLHEIGHAVAGWVNGVVVVPTPAKEYILQSQLDWSKEVWIALGGVIGTTVAALAAAFYLWPQPSSDREAVLAGAFLPVGVYIFDLCWSAGGTMLRSGRLHKLLSVCRRLATR
jgi:hypothetical protein